MRRQSCCINWILSFVSIGIVSSAASAQGTARPACESIQYRLVDEAAPDSAHRYRKGTGESFALRDSVVLDGRAIEHIELEPSGLGEDSWDVLARLTSAGGEKMLAVSTNHPDQHIAVLLGDEILEVAVIAGPIRTVVPLRIGAPRREADSLVARANRARTGCTAPTR